MPVTCLLHCVSCVCRYSFATPSTLKPTQWHYPSGSIFRDLLLPAVTILLHCVSCACRYSFATPSTLKPTQWHYPSGSINQIPGTATICGDMRVTPFYDVEEVGVSAGWRSDLIYSDVKGLRVMYGPLTQ
jgi:hypothetical protein